MVQQYGDKSSIPKNNTLVTARIKTINTDTKVQIAVTLIILYSIIEQ